MYKELIGAFIEQLDSILKGWETDGYSASDGRGTCVFILVSQIKRRSKNNEAVEKCKELQKKQKDDITKEELSELLKILKNQNLDKELLQ